MEYVYGAMLLHTAGKEVNEEALKKVMKASGAKVDDARVKALVSALEGVNIDEALSSAAVAPAASAAAPAAAVEAKEEKPKVEKKAEEEEKTEEEAASGLASLFG